MEAWRRWIRVVAIVASLTGCADGSGNDGTTSPRDLGGAVIGWHDGRAELVAELFDGLALRPIAQGVLDAAARVSLTLPASLDPDVVRPIADDLACSDLTAEPAEARVASLFSLTVAQGGGALGAIAQASTAEATFPLPSQVGAYRVFRWYVDRDASIRGTCATTFGGYDFEHVWDLELEQGWNVVVETITELGEGREARETRTSPIPNGTNWYFLDAVMAPE